MCVYVCVCYIGVMMDSNLSRNAYSIFFASYVNKTSCIKLTCHCIDSKTTIPLALCTFLRTYLCAAPLRLGI